MDQIERILVIEDEPVVQELLVETLEEHGFATIVAGSQQEAYVELRAERYDLVLLDLKLPASIGSMEKATQVGLDILGWIREKEIKKARSDLPIPVIVLTAFAEFELVRTAFRHLANEFITKPFSPDELVDAIEIAISGDGFLSRVAPSQDMLVRIAFYDSLRLAQVESLAPIDGKRFALLRELGRFFEEDRRSGRDPAQFRGVPQKHLSSVLEVAESSVGKYIERLRTHFQGEFRRSLRRPLHRQAIVENRRDWEGYRLNPVTVHLVDPAALPLRKA
jgi:CheY-like chemotaxis protein